MGSGMGVKGRGVVQASETEPVITSFLDTMHWFSHGLAALWAKGKEKGKGEKIAFSHLLLNCPGCTKRVVSERQAEEEEKKEDGDNFLIGARAPLSPRSHPLGNL